jgi:hypothetical protein
MRGSHRFDLRRLGTLGVVVLAVAVLGAANPHPTNAGGDWNNQGNFSGGWAFILEFPTGNVNAVAFTAIRGGQLAGSALISGKRCLFKVSGTFTGDVDSGGTLTMTWTGQKTCTGEVLALSGSVVNNDITGTFTDTTVAGGPFGLTGNALSDQNGQH